MKLAHGCHEGRTVFLGSFSGIWSTSVGHSLERLPLVTRSDQLNMLSQQKAYLLSSGWPPNVSCLLINSSRSDRRMRYARLNAKALSSRSRIQMRTVSGCTFSSFATSSTVNHCVVIAWSFPVSFGMNDTTLFHIINFGKICVNCLISIRTH
jgi:hypothetical protein